MASVKFNGRREAHARLDQATQSADMIGQADARSCDHMVVLQLETTLSRFSLEDIAPPHAEFETV